MWNKEVGRSRVFVARNLRNWARLNPAEPHRAVGHLFSANASGSFCTLHSPSLPSPQRWNLVLKGFRVVLSQFLCPGLFPSCAVTSGCQQATTADTDGSPGLWWLPYVTSLLQVSAAFFFFLKMFFFPSLISFAVWLFKMAWAGRERWVPSRLERVKHDAH